MNREIKFRSLYEGVWYYQTLEETLTITLAAFRNGKHKSQFTGLKDKNDKEIYEGDILNRKGYTWGMRSGDKLIPNIISSENILMKQQRMVVAKFEISNSGICFSLPKDENYAERTHPATYEIVGNIYEHPELMIGKTLYE